MLYDFGPRARRVYQALLDRVRSGELAPGARLPAHTQLAASFGVAPLTVRQVLARLEADRVVVRERGRGTFVRSAETTATPSVLIVAVDPDQRAQIEQQVRVVRKRPVLAATSAEALATLEREALPSMAIVELHLPHAGAGLRLVRSLRQLLPELPIAVLNPTGAQRTRLEHTVAPPLLFIGDAPLVHLSQVLRAQVPAPESSRSASDSTLAKRLQRLLDRYVVLQLAGDRTAARSLMLEGLAGGLSISDLYSGVLEPAQYRIGQLWQDNQISVAREHLATAVTENVMVNLLASAPRERNTGMRVLVACVESELHDIGARMVADLLELDGFGVRFLGADVPTESLLSIVRDESPRLLILSAAMPERLVLLRSAVARLRRAYGPDLRIFVGGQIMDRIPELMPGVEVELATRDIVETLAAARQLRAADNSVSPGQRSVRPPQASVQKSARDRRTSPEDS